MICGRDPEGGLLIDFAVHGRTALLTINRPEARNAVNREVAEALEAAIDRLVQGGANCAGLVTRERSRPLMAAVDGPALAGGCELALACDLIVASPAARFGLPEVKRSLVPAAGGLARLPQVLPRQIATALMLTGDTID